MDWYFLGCYLHIAQWVVNVEMGQAQNGGTEAVCTGEINWIYYSWYVTMFDT